MVKGVLDYSEFKDVDMVIEVSWKYSTIGFLKMYSNSSNSSY